MTAQDQSKLVRAGFTIIRKDVTKLQIKYKDIEHQDWKYYETKYQSKAALDRDFKALLQLENRIAD
jgi:hypothetical protein